MPKFFAVVKNELLRYFTSPTAYVYLLAFLFLNASFTLYLGHFQERGEASLSVMFAFQPWIYLIFISGIAMRLWSEEFKTGTIVQIMTLPASAALFVRGKFAAAWLFCTAALALTFPFAVTVNLLGSPDNGIIAASYLGSFLLSGAMLAVAQTMSALTRSQVIALVLSVIANLLFFLSGIEYVLGFFRPLLPHNLVESIAQLSFLSHYGELCRGSIGLRDIVFFISVIWLFNFICGVIVNFKTAGVTPFLKNGGKTVCLLLTAAAWLGFAGFNMTVNALLPGVKLDATEDKLYTVPKEAEHILQNIREPVTVKVYYSTVLSQRNQLFRQAVERIDILLKTWQSVAAGKLSYKFYYPEPFNKAEDMALHDGLTPIPLPDLNQNAFFGITLVDEGGNRRVIPFIPLENADQAGLEIIQNIYELSHPKPTLGLITSLPLFGLSVSDDKVGSSWEIVDELQKLYTLKTINTPQDLNGIDVLMLIHPQNLSDDLTEKIAEYTLNGGKILVLADVAAEAQRLYSPVNQQLTPSTLHNLDKLWGFEFNPQLVIADLENSVTVNTGSKGQAQFAQDVIQFTAGIGNINSTQPETKRLKSLLFASATPVSHLANHDTTFIPLVQTSANSALMPAAVVYRNMNPSDILAQFKSDDEVKTVAAKIISNKPEHPFEVIVIGDSDFAYDAFWSQFNTLDDHKYLVLLNDNATLIFNALDALSGHTALIPLRGSNNTFRRFEAREKLRRQNSLQLAAREREVLARINAAKNNLNDLWRKKNFEERQDFSDDELAVIAKFRQSLTEMKQQLADLRFHINDNIARQQALTVFFNLYAVPLLIALIIGITVLSRRKKAKYKTCLRPAMTKRAVTAAAFCLLLFGTGLVLALKPFSSGSDFENKPVFPDWENQLNNIRHINIQNNGRRLHLYQQDGQWQAEGFEQYPLYQRRVINLLASLANARYLERKSARAEYLPKFGLNADKATTLTLGDADQHTVLQFDIGNYDEEIGRGGRGAFLKFTNRFQVWLIEADFISLSPDWRDWSMNTALNLRFGRILSSDLTDDSNQLVLLSKELLNTPLTVTETKPDNLKPLRRLTLIFENGDSLTMVFEQSKDKYYLWYEFDKQPAGNYLQLFTKYAIGKRYEIPQQNMEKINHVFDAVKQRRS